MKKTFESTNQTRVHDNCLESGHVIVVWILCNYHSLRSAAGFLKCVCLYLEWVLGNFQRISTIYISAWSQPPSGLGIEFGVGVSSTQFCLHQIQKMFIRLELDSNIPNLRWKPNQIKEIRSTNKLRSYFAPCKDPVILCKLQHLPREYVDDSFRTQSVMRR